MATEDGILQRTLTHALSGRGAHVEANDALAGLDWKLAGAQPNRAPHSIHQLVDHMSFWDAWVVNWLDGDDPAIPERASGSWTETVGPADAQEWEQTVARFATLADELSRRALDGDLLATGIAAGATKSRLEMLQTIASHRSYHLGQIVLVRQMLGDWPPPSGGLTW